MIELRWLKKKIVVGTYRHEENGEPKPIFMADKPVLQYRTMKPARILSLKWSEWRDVPEVSDD